MPGPGNLFVISQKAGVWKTYFPMFDWDEILQTLLLWLEDIVNKISAKSDMGKVLFQHHEISGLHNFI